MEGGPTRREFLFGRANKTASEDSVKAVEQAPEFVTLTKRDFLSYIGTGALAASLAAALPGEVQAKEQESAAKADAELVARNALREDADASYAETALQTELVLAANTLGQFVFKKLGIPLGNAAITEDSLHQEHEARNPYASLLKDDVLKPILEEAAYRLIPSILLTGGLDVSQKSPGTRWDVGIPMTAVFALVHNAHHDEEGKFAFAKNVPIDQFVSGLFYWYLMRERGFSHAAAAHVLNNSSATAIGELLVRTLPDKE